MLLTLRRGRSCAGPQTMFDIFLRRSGYFPWVHGIHVLMMRESINHYYSGIQNGKREGNHGHASLPMKQ